MFMASCKANTYLPFAKKRSFMGLLNLASFGLFGSRPCERAVGLHPIVG